MGYNGQSGYDVDIYGHKRVNPKYYGNRTQYEFKKLAPETADWITGPDFGLRRAQELRREILSTKAELQKLH